MVAVEHPFDIGKVEHFVVAVIPRQIEECIQIGILQCVFRRVHAVAHQTPHFLLECLAGLFRPFLSGGALAEFCQFVVILIHSELILHGADLRAQELLLLPSGQLRGRTALHLLLHHKLLHLKGQQFKKAFAALLYVSDA